MTQVLAADDYMELPVSDAQAATGVTAAWSAGDAGTVVRLTTNGFGGAIDLMVGVDNENKVTAWPSSPIPRRPRSARTARARTSAPSSAGQDR